MQLAKTVRTHQLHLVSEMLTNKTACARIDSIARTSKKVGLFLRPDSIKKYLKGLAQILRLTIILTWRESSYSYIAFMGRSYTAAGTPRLSLLRSMDGAKIRRVMTYDVFKNSSASFTTGQFQWNSKLIILITTPKLRSGDTTAREGSSKENWWHSRSKQFPWYRRDEREKKNVRLSGKM